MAQNVKRRTHQSLAPRKSLLLYTSQEGKEYPTNYLETSVHLFKGNVGAGLFAMGTAFKNAGFIVAPILIVVIAVIIVHCQHILLNCSEKMRIITQEPYCADYADTVEQCFENGPQRLQSWSKFMKATINSFICVTQLGFCCIYLIFIGTNLKQILLANGVEMDLQVLLLICCIPVLFASLITNLKYLTPVSLFANISTLIGLIIVIYFAVKDGVPNDFDDRALYTNIPQLGLFFGTVMFTYESIALVLPLRNAMAEPKDFNRPLGVLNVTMVFVTVVYLCAGAAGYMKWGEHVGGSLTLNMGDTSLAQIVKAFVAVGVLLGYPLQFFIAIQIMWEPLSAKPFPAKHPFVSELTFRTLMVLLTLCLAELIPGLGVFISLIGALCSTALALAFPVIIELLIKDEDEKKGPSAWVYIKNIFIFIIAVYGTISGTYESMVLVVKHFEKEIDITND